MYHQMTMSTLQVIHDKNPQIVIQDENPQIVIQDKNPQIVIQDKNPIVKSTMANDHQIHQPRK